MIKECKKGFRKIKNICVPNGKTFGSEAKKLPKITKTILIGVLLSVAGWALFNWFIEVTNLTSYSIWWQFAFGLVVTIIALIAGWKS